MVVDEGLELSEEDALRLLATRDVGRVGVTIGALPAIFPVTYRLVDGAIVFRTAPGTRLSAAADRAVVAFETDDYSPAGRAGWSVLVVGRAEIADDPALWTEVLDAAPPPFAGASRRTIVRILPELVTGRRIVTDPPGSGLVPTEALTPLLGRRVGVARVDRSCIGDAILQSVSAESLCLHLDGLDVIVPRRDVLDVWEAGR